MDELYETDEADEADEADEVNLEELLAELEELDEDEADEEDEEGMINEEEEGEEETEEGEEDVDIEALLKSPEDLKDFITDIVKDIMGEEGTDVEGEEEGEEEEETEAKPIDEYTLDELLAELKSTKTAKKVAKKDDKKEKVEEIFGKLAAKLSGKGKDSPERAALIDKTKKALEAKNIEAQDLITYKDGDSDNLEDQIAKYVDSKAKDDSFSGEFQIVPSQKGGYGLVWRKKLSGIEKVAAGTSAQTTGGGSAYGLSEELNEAYSVINTLRSELNEVNLLNAKLLYTNKIFKNRSLTETQKVKVLTAFDKANSVKEAKLVYETLLENLKTTKSSVNESMGFASKAMGTSTKTPIVESNMMVDRFKKLAGII